MNYRLPALAALSLLALAGCATVKGDKLDRRDPYETANRATFRFNDALDRGIAKPVAKAYHNVTPQFAQRGVSNFMANAGYPTVIVNDFLQAKFRDGFADLGRLLLNSSFGLGGLLDPATAAGLESHDEDFGQTLGKWGVSSGAYLVLPLLGPSTMRDGFGMIADAATDPRQYINDSTIKWSLQALRQVDRRMRLLDADAVLERAADKYVLVRSAYLQRREYQVKDGNIPDQQPEDMEDPDPGADTPPQPADPSASAPPK
jgi:phospholipid-binding lipoprotein MlaA